MAERHGIDAEELLAHAGWLRALALRLARDPDDAEDLVQETWIASMRRSPDDSEKVRPWLTKILVNTFRMRRRSDTRRTAREEATHVVEHAPGSDALVARAELQQKLVNLVLELAEPYRSTVLLHFCEGVSLAEIARTHDVPAGTVRWRLKFALDRLRTQLDEKSGGRKQWAVPLLAFSKGLFVAQKTSKLVAVALILLLLLVVGGIVLHGRGKRGAGSSSGSGAQAGGGGALVAGQENAGGTTGNSDKTIPMWLAQRDVAARRIAGKVTFNGAPVAGATVELASLASEAGLVAAPRKTTDASGTFDFGTQLAMEWSVRASAPGKTGATIELDLRDPTSRPAPDKLELRLGTCSAAIFGVVRDASGGSIASARLTRLNVDGPAMGPTGSTSVPGGPSVTTDNNGAYELCAEAKWPGWVSVDVSAEGYGAIVFTGLVPGRIRVDFALVPEATIVGRVVDGETGEPIAHAYVLVPRGPPGSETTAQRATFSDEAGKFKIDRVAPGPHTVLAEAAGYVATQRGVPVTIDAGQTSIELVIRMEHGSTIRGVVHKDDKPVAGAHVSFASQGDDAWRQPVAVSQNDGSFVLTNVPHGPIRFTAHPYDVTSPETFMVSQPEHEGVVLEVKELGAIVGRVTRDQKPVPGAHMFINGPNERDLSPVIADSDGHYEVHGLRPGPWTVGASSEPHGAFGTEPKAVQVQLGKTAEVNIDLAFAASIAGKVVDQTGAPVPGVALLFRHTQADDAGWAVTDVDGTFRAAMMTGGGQYTTMIRLRPLSMLALKPAAGGEFPLITLTDGASAVTGIVLTVKIDHMTISGKVVDAAGGPVPDARVVAELIEGNGAPRFFRGLQDPAATTDVDGRFAIDDLLDGTYALRARSPAGAEATFMGVRAGTKDLSIVLSEPGAIEGTIAGFKSAPQISAFRRASTAAPVFASPQGTSFVLRNLPPGTYMVTARSATEAASATVSVDAATTSRVTLTSTGSGVIAGRVIEFRSKKPVEGLTCRALPRIENATSAVGTENGVLTNAQGEYQIAQAPAGEIVLQCDGLRGLYSNGSRLLTLQAGKRLDVDVPVVAIPQPTPISELGANFAMNALVPTLFRVEPNGPAATAGLQNGDVIVSVDGTSVTELSPDGVWILITNRTVGSKVKLGALRAGKSITAEVTLGSLH